MYLHLGDESGSNNYGVKSFLSMLSIPGVFIGEFLTMAVTNFGINAMYPFIGSWLIAEVSWWTFW